MRIYTKNGDRGDSDLYTGERRSKTDAVFQSLGDLDELNAVLGLAAQHLAYEGAARRSIDEQIQVIQSRLLDVGSAVATPLTSASDAKLNRTQFGDTETTRLEGWIDDMDNLLPPLTAFILPSGGLAACQVHQARAICRRAERSTVPLVTAGSTDAAVGRYLNRLSDYLFTLARYVAKLEGGTEVVYKKPREA